MNSVSSTATIIEIILSCLLFIILFGGLTILIAYLIWNDFWKKVEDNFNNKNNKSL